MLISQIRCILEETILTRLTIWHVLVGNPVHISCSCDNAVFGMNLLVNSSSVSERGGGVALANRQWEEELGVSCTGGVALRL